tara:strand:+ start:23483 stop:23641 length:159 start_codon:yes stop_codon:yes gene_type:complete
MVQPNGISMSLDQIASAAEAGRPQSECPDVAHPQVEQGVPKSAIRFSNHEVS